MQRIVIVGGGVAGLATALHIADRARVDEQAVQITVLEAQDRFGGNIHTDEADGYIIEQGPNGYLNNVKATTRLVARLKLNDLLLPASENASARYLYRHGKLHALPTGPVGMLRSPLLSLRGRLRVFCEPLGPAPAKNQSDESVFAFASRRIGREAASVLVDAMVSGVFAGNAHTLSLQSAFPKMAAMEREHGSLVKAMISRMWAGRKQRNQRAAKEPRAGGPAGPSGVLTSFRGGLERLIDALVRELKAAGVHLQTNAKVAAIRQNAPHAVDPWQVCTEAGEAHVADAVVVAIPSPIAASLFSTVDASLANAVGAIPSASLAVVALGFDDNALGARPTGFGFLVPRGEGLRMLGCLWDASVFPDRAPAGKSLLRVMIGGAHDLDAVTLDDAELLRVVQDELKLAMAITAKPELVRIYRHRQGIAQYTLGHQARLRTIAQRLQTLPGLRVTGCSYFGISMNACIEGAEVFRVGA